MREGTADPATRDAIAIARVVCILGIVYVHAWTGVGGDVLNDPRSGQALLRWSLVELFGRSAVPLLTLVSGWLVAGSLRRPGGYRAFLPAKARTLLAPMLIWNALSILLVSGAGALGLIEAPVPRTLWWLADELFCLASPNDINVQTAFLRDLFLCMAAAPLLVRLPGAALAAIAMLVLAWIGSGVQAVVLLRPQILLFFVGGIALARTGLPARLARLPVAVVLAPFAAVAGFNLWLDLQGHDFREAHRGLLALADVPVRVGGALCFWRLANALARSRAAPRLLRLERYAFLLFCCHLILIWLAGPAIGRLTGPLGAPAWPAFLIAQPLLALAATIALGRLLAAAAPRFAMLASGGRLGRTGRGDAPATLARERACATPRP
ncbi:MAG: acyltransferase [Sphingomonas sp.]